MRHLYFYDLIDLCIYHDWVRFKAVTPIDNKTWYGTIYKCYDAKKVRTDVLINYNNISVVERGSIIYIIDFDRTPTQGWYKITKVFQEGKKKQLPNSYFLNKTYFM